VLAPLDIPPLDFEAGLPGQVDKRGIAHPRIIPLFAAEPIIQNQA
jgi:hypothetical protein